MKRINIIMIALMTLVASNAFASQARQIVMGSGDPLAVLDRGSWFYDGNDNIFYNPAYANDYKNWATIEVSRIGATGGSTLVAGVPTAAVATGTTAEGGFVTGIGSWNLGFYMNRLNPNYPFFAGALGTGHHPIDVIIAGDAGVKWGLGVSLGMFKGGTGLTQTNMDLSAGLVWGDLEPFFNVKVIGSDKIVAGVESKFSGFGGGLRYRYGEWTPYIGYKSLTAPGGKAVNWGLGLGRNTKIGEAHLTYGLGIWDNANTKHLVIPVDMAVEGELASWLSARAGFTFNLYDQTGNANTTTVNAAGTILTTDTTNARLGATIHIAKMDFDWVVGHGAGADTVSGKTFDFAGGFFSVASATYHW